jgi:dephospho-CoA kinase
MQHTDAMYVIWESALIPYGTPGVDRTLIISANTGDQLARIHARNPEWSQDQVMGFLKQQRRTIYKCNDVISNGGTLEDLKWEVDHLHEGYDKLWEKKRESSTDIDG